MNERQAIHEISEKHCKNCQIRLGISRKFTRELSIKFCSEQCPIGKGLKNIGEVLEYGTVIRTGKDFTQEDYEKLVERGLTDREIVKKLGIGSNTLCRRKRQWGLTHQSPLDDFTIEEYNELKLMRLSDKEIAKMKGFSFRSLNHWKSQNKVFAPSVLTELLIDKDKSDYLPLKVSGYTDVEVAKEWNVSRRTLTRWKKEKGISHYG